MRTICRVLRTLFFKRMIFVADILLAILLCILALSARGTAEHARAARAETQTTYESVCISSGDSLWSIAQKYRGTKDTAVFVEDLKMLNGLSSDRIQAGYYILVPVTSMYTHER